MKSGPEHRSECLLKKGLIPISVDNDAVMHQDVSEQQAYSCVANATLHAHLDGIISGMDKSHFQVEKVEHYDAAGFASRYGLLFLQPFLRETLPFSTPSYPLGSRIK